MSIEKFLPRKVMENDKEIGEALEFSDGTIAIRLFKDRGKVHLLNLVPIQRIDSVSPFVGDLTEKRKGRWANAIDDAASKEVAEKYRCPVEQRMVDMIINEISGIDSSKLNREFILKTIKSILFREGIPASRELGYFSYLSKRNIIYLRKSGTKGVKSTYFFHPFYLKNKKKKSEEGAEVVNDRTD